jgi:predicted DNA-binding transcriptional regulator AlpA
MLYNNKEVINLKELSQMTGLSKSTLWKKTMNREIPHYKVSKMLFFNVAEINKWLQSNKVQTKEEIIAETIILTH